MKRQTEDKVVRYVQGWERPPAQLYYTSIPRAAPLGTLGEIYRRGAGGGGERGGRGEMVVVEEEEGKLEPPGGIGTTDN